MNKWPQLREDFFAWLRIFPLIMHIDRVGTPSLNISAETDPVYLNADFWSQRTYETEAWAGKQLTEIEIDFIFDEVASIIDENLSRFDPLINYYGRFFPLGDRIRIEAERDAAHSVK